VGGILISPRFSTKLSSWHLNSQIHTKQCQNAGLGVYKWSVMF